MLCVIVAVLVIIYPSHSIFVAGFYSCLKISIGLSNDYCNFDLNKSCFIYVLRECQYKLLSENTVSICFLCVGPREILTPRLPSQLETG